MTLPQIKLIPEKGSLVLWEDNKPSLTFFYLMYHFLIFAFPFNLFRFELINSNHLQRTMCNEYLAAPILRGRSRWMRVLVGLSDLRQEGAPWKEDQNKLVLLPVLIRVNGQLQRVCCIFC